MVTWLGKIKGQRVKNLLQTDTHDFLAELENGAVERISDTMLEQLTRRGPGVSVPSTDLFSTWNAATATFMTPQTHNGVAGTAIGPMRQGRPIPIPYTDFIEEDAVEHCAYCGAEWHPSKYRHGTCEACGAPRATIKVVQYG